MNEKEQQFEDVVQLTLEKCHEVLVAKGREYRRNGNPFHQFEKGASITGQTREEVIWGMALKHFISIQDIRKDMVEGKLPSKELVDEKYGDLINYLLIEKASIYDKLGEIDTVVIEIKSDTTGAWKANFTCREENIANRKHEEMVKEVSDKWGLKTEQSL